MTTSNQDLPRLARKILRFICPMELFESIEGDLLENFEEDVLNKGVPSARRRYIWNAMRFIHPEIMLRNKFKAPIMNYGLFKNHAKISLRNLIKGRVYSLINISGLSLGMAACMLILCFTQFEKSYDSFLPGVNQLYRVNQTAIWDNNGGIMSSTAPPLAALLVNQYPEVESAMRLNTPGDAQLRYQDSDGHIHAYNESNILAADSNFFSFFQLPLLAGNPDEALRGVGKVVITEDIAQKYFGNINALGKTFEYGESRLPLQVSAVLERLPKNMHLDFDFLISMPTNRNVKEFDWSWIWTQMVTYVRLKPNTNLQNLESRLLSIPDDFIASTFDRIGMDFENFVSDRDGWIFQLQPVKNIHLSSDNIANRIARTMDGSIVNILELLAILILIVAMINFVNLSTARSSTRNKEIGVKKTMGASPASLVQQFLFESILISLIAMLVAFPLVSACRYLVFKFTLIDISLAPIFNLPTLGIVVICTIFIGLLAGLYPSFYLSRFKIERVLKNDQRQFFNPARLRNVLVVVQFAVSMALVAGTALIVKQLHFIKNKDLGFNKENVLVINHAEILGNQLESFRNDIANKSNIKHSSISMDMPGRGTWEDIFMREGSNIKLPIAQVKIDDNFFSVMEFHMLAGRTFDATRPADNHSVIINQTTSRLFGWTIEESLGKKIIYPGYPEDIRVIGVVDDFNNESLRQAINPLMFFNLRSAMWGDMRVVAIRYDNVPTNILLNDVQQTWEKYANGAPFSYSFYDEELAMLYEDETQMGNLIGLFAGFTLFIAIIGLIGMVTYSVEKRKKEIGIRKVLGASVAEIFMMFNKQYMIMGLIAMAISVPISYHSLNEWLEGFAFRVDLHPVIFIISGVTVMTLAGLSVAYLSLRAAWVQPSEVLKDE